MSSLSLGISHLSLKQCFSPCQLNRIPPSCSGSWWPSLTVSVALLLNGTLHSQGLLGWNHVFSHSVYIDYYLHTLNNCQLWVDIYSYIENPFASLSCWKPCFLGPRKFMSYFEWHISVKERTHRPSLNSLLTIVCLPCVHETYAFFTHIGLLLHKISQGWETIGRGWQLYHYIKSLLRELTYQ